MTGNINKLYDLAPSQVNASLRVIWSLPHLTEARLQRLIPERQSYYHNSFEFFLDIFLTNFLDQMTLWDGITILGHCLLHNKLIEALAPHREMIEKISSHKVDDLVIFLGDGNVMELVYRSIGTCFPEISKAIAGANSCYVNVVGPDGDPLLPLLPSTHEFCHTAVNRVLNKITGDVYKTDANKVMHEALGGPSKEAWANLGLQQLELDFKGLATGNFWEWYTTETSRLSQPGEFFNNPVAAGFYLDYVFKDKTYEDWFNMALAI